MRTRSRRLPAPARSGSARHPVTRRLPWSVPAMVVTAAAIAACGSGTPGTAAVPPPASSAPPTTLAAPTTVAAAPTTAVYQPTAPQVSATAAVGALLSAWGRQDRPGAGAVATPPAVVALFADPPRALQWRGCSDGAAPVTCSYADRSSATGHFYEIDAGRTAAGGWYVVSVQVDT